MPAQLPPALRGLPHGVYENSGIAVRIPPERVYEISRNQHRVVVVDHLVYFSSVSALLEMSSKSA